MYARIIDMGGVQTVAEIIDDAIYAKIPAPLNAEFVPEEPGMVYMATLENGVWTAPPEPTPLPEMEPTPEPDPPTPAYKVLTFVEFISVVQTFGGVGDAEAVDILANSTAAPIVLVRMLLDKMDDRIARDNPVMLGGLQKLISAGYLTEAEKDAILDNWPTV